MKSKVSPGLAAAIIVGVVVVIVVVGWLVMRGQGGGAVEVDETQPMMDDTQAVEQAAQPEEDPAMGEAGIPGG